MKQRVHNNSQHSSNSRGAALLTVLVSMMVISILILEMQFAASIERKLAYNELNQLQAYYLAKSGARMGLLRVALYGRLKRSPEVKNLASKFPVDSYLDLVWNLPLPAFPPDLAQVKQLDSQEKAKAEETLEKTKISEGRFSYVISNESAKFNLNHLVVTTQPRPERIDFRSPPQGLYHYVAVSILNYLEKLLRDSEDPFKEYGNMKPEEVVSDIMDWVNSGSERFAGGDKDAYYERQNPPYRAKRSRFFTTDELRLVRGIDNHLFEKLRPIVTVYSYDGRININNARDEVIRALYPDFTDDDLKRINEERTKLGSWANEKQFVDYVSSTLGRSGFRTLYDKEENYPFTVSSQSFLIESLGSVQKSKTEIQKVIRVAVALTSGKGGTIAQNINNKADCDKAGLFWQSVAQTCLNPPTSSQECSNAAGTFIPDTRCCKFNNIPEPYCPSKDAKKKAEANSLKVLHWSES